MGREIVVRLIFATEGTARLHAVIAVRNFPVYRHKLSYHTIFYEKKIIILVLYILIQYWYLREIPVDVC